MALQWISISEVPRRGSKRDASICMDEVELFWRSPHDACIVDVTRYKQIRNAQSAYLKAVKTLGFPIKVVTRGGQMFMIKKEALQNA